ncbi:PEP-utilizing enzyme, partial [Aquitalea magnusonii]|uniref:PEP-utilizing enzyme n=1 Tax=Aquitalea magnusonii TaxID=332411 RepID=UPI001EFA69A9
QPAAGQGGRHADRRRRATAHVAILARALGIPALVACGPAALQLHSGQQVLLDASQGCCHPAPDERTLSEAATRIARAGPATTAHAGLRQCRSRHAGRRQHRQPAAGQGGRHADRRRRATAHVAILARALGIPA